MLEKIKQIYLCMGSACNANCKYCSQHKTNFELQESNISDKLRSYLEDITKYRDNTDNKLNIIFWGGEPLLYMDTIKEVISILKDSVNYGLVSNGLLISEDIVEFLNSNNISYTLSNDGPNTIHTRGFNVLDNPEKVELFKKIDHFAIELVLTAYSYNLNEIEKYYNVLFGYAPNLEVDTLYCFNNTSSDLYTFTNEQYNVFSSVCKDVFDRVYNELINNNTLGHNYYIMKKWIDNIINKEQNNIEPLCDVLHKRLDIDMQGNILTCHNYNVVIGTTDDFLSDINCKQDKIIHYVDEECRKCSYNSICLHCPHPDYSIEGNKAICILRRIIMSRCVEFVKRFDSLYEKVEL